VPNSTTTSGRAMFRALEDSEETVTRLYQETAKALHSEQVARKDGAAGRRADGHNPEQSTPTSARRSPPRGVVKAAGIKSDSLHRGGTGMEDAEIRMDPGIAACLHADSPSERRLGAESQARCSAQRMSTRRCLMGRSYGDLEKASSTRIPACP